MKKLSQNKSLAFDHWSKNPSFQKSTPLDALEALLNEESTSCETTSWEVPSDPMFPLSANLNKSLGAMAESMLAMNQLLKCLCSEPSNATDDDPACKTCSMDALSASEDDGEDPDKDIKAFCGNIADGALNKKRGWIEQPDNNDPLLLEIMENFLDADEMGPAINKSLPTLLTASGPKKYRSPNLRIRWWNIYCETLITQWNNPEIWDNMTNPVILHDLWSMQKTIGTMVLSCENL